MRSYWENDDKPKASAADIARIQAVINGVLPVPYVEFITQYGFVVFGRDAEERYHFNYQIIFPDRREIREGNIRFLHRPDRLLIAYDNLTQPDIDANEISPSFPPQYLPIGNDAGQGQILLELGENSGRVWYWPYKEWAWGTEDNTWLGFVAEDFYGFINGLRA